ncbi:MAG: transporter substrate-binding domain-containing protein, partial [Myxococcales bacterium]|nr:transporter substrate-binding domain-containing protein [Myxococcales bacterium]
MHPIRRWLAGDVLPSLVPELLTALGESGDANDIASILEHIHLDPFRCGQPGLKALVALKRRGVSPNDDEARALLALLLEHAGLDAEAAAEVMSSRADIVVDALDVVAPADPHWPSIVSLLESFGTRRAIERLRSIVARAEERAGWWYAVRALGRLGARDAEADILARLDDAVAALFDDDISAIVGDSSVLEYYAHTHPDLTLDVVGNIFRPNKYGFAFTPGSPLAKPASLAIIWMHDGGEIEKIR